MAPDVRALWMDMLCYMWESVETGVMVSPNGVPYTKEEIVRMVGLDCKGSSAWLDVLIENGVCGVRSDGAIYSRRMVRDADLREKRAAAGRKGGRASRCRALGRNAAEQPDFAQMGLFGDGPIVDGGGKSEEEVEKGPVMAGSDGHAGRDGCQDGRQDEKSSDGQAAPSAEEVKARSDCPAQAVDAVRVESDVSEPSLFPGMPKVIPKKKGPPPKIRFAEFVMMTQMEYDKLVIDHGKAAADWMVQKLDNSKGSTGRKYVSDYRAICNWVIDAYYNNESGRYGKKRCYDRDIGRGIEESGRFCTGSTL